MSEQTVALAREVMAALGGRDAEAVIALADAQVEWHSFFAELGEEGVYRGHAGTREYMADLTDAWEAVWAEIDDAVAVGDVAVLVGRIRYRGKGSGIETATPAGWMLRFRHGLVLRFRAFREPDRALEAVGVTAPGAWPR